MILYYLTLISYEFCINISFYYFGDSIFQLNQNSLANDLKNLKNFKLNKFQNILFLVKLLAISCIMNYIYPLLLHYIAVACTYKQEKEKL